MNKVADHNSVQTEFEKQYLLLREREGRVYSDEEVRRLPHISKQHPLSSEWKLRKFSAGKLLQYLSKQQKPLDVLEVGCGNGWLSHQLSLISGSRITGIDLNAFELEQAKRVFQAPQLHFLFGDFRQFELQKSFDVILFAASLQYFPSLPAIIYAAMELLNEGGEIHIVDTHFYHERELADARQRSRKYFNELGFPLMEDFYFHHSIKDLDGFSYDLLYNPAGVTNRLMKLSPFPWIRLKKC